MFLDFTILLLSPMSDDLLKLSATSLLIGASRILNKIFKLGRWDQRTVLIWSKMNKLIINILLNRFLN